MFWWKFCLVSRRPPLPEIGCTSIHTKDRKTIYSPCAISKTFLTICYSFLFSLPSITLFSLSLVSLSSLLSPCRSWFTVVVHGSQRCFRSSFSGSGPIWFSVVGFRGWSNPIGFLGLLAVAGEQRSWMVLGVFQASRSFRNRITTEVTRTLKKKNLGTLKFCFLLLQEGFI